jgi:hypothetical protein
MSQEREDTVKTQNKKYEGGKRKKNMKDENVK